MSMFSSYLWLFGDGKSSNEQAPNHVYEMAGVYTATLIITLINGSTSQSSIIIYVYDQNYGIPVPSLTNTCYRLPVKSDEGFGPVEYKDSDNPGFDWIWPSSEKGTVKGYDEQRREIALVIDAKTQKIYKINGPDIWRDRAGYGLGNRIISEVHEKSYEAQQGKFAAIVHTETHIKFEAHEKELKGSSGYDSEGFPSDMRVDIQMHIDNRETEEKKAIRVPKDGDLVYQEKLEAHQLQNRIKVYEAPWLLAEINHEYETIDKSAVPTERQMAESTFQENLSSLPLLHVSRSFTPMMNRANGAEATGTYSILITGPDEREYSGMYFTAGNGISDTLEDDLSGDFTLSAWFKTMLTVPVTLFSCGALTVSIQPGYILRYTDGVNTFNWNLTFNGVSWSHIVITRSGISLNAYENKTSLGTQTLVSVENCGDNFKCIDVAEGSVFDVLVLPRVLSLEEIEYYYDNVLKGGGEVLPDL